MIYFWLLIYLLLTSKLDEVLNESALLLSEFLLSFTKLDPVSSMWFVINSNEYLSSFYLEIMFYIISSYPCDEEILFNSN